MAGDFIAVISREERRGDSVSFNNTEMREFDSFRYDMELIDVPLLGKKFYCFGFDGKSMSRIDRFLPTEGIVSRCNIKTQWRGDRDISNHCLVWLMSSNLN